MQAELRLQKEEVSQQCGDMQQLCFRHRADSMHRGSVISQLERRLSDLAAEKEARLTTILSCTVHLAG